MRLNAMFPTRDVGNDPAKIRDWAQAAEDLGFALYFAATAAVALPGLALIPFIRPRLQEASPG